VSERLIWAEESGDKRLLLYASGTVDKSSLVALESFTKRQRKRLKSKGLLSQLSPEQRAAVLSYNGPEASGDQSLPKVTPSPEITHEGE
jgi:hypothetical protein